MKFDVKTQGKKMEVALEGRMDSATTLPILRIFPVPD